MRTWYLGKSHFTTYEEPDMRQETFSVAELPARTIRKIQDDVRRLRRLARFVIVLDESGAVRETIENYPESYECFTRPVIAILAPTKIGDKTLPETLVFEMTYERAVPYTRIEENLPGGGKRIPIPARHRVRTITESELRLAWPALEQGFVSILRERLYHWKSLGNLFWLGKKNGFYSGILFRCKTEDIAAYREFWREHLRYRSGDLLDILDSIRHYKRPHYNNRQLSAMKGARTVARVLAERRIVERRYIIERTRRLKPLLECICAWKGIETTEEDPHSPTSLIFGRGTDKKGSFPIFSKISSYFREKPREFHAKGCFSVEIIPKPTLAMQWRNERGKDMERRNSVISRPHEHKEDDLGDIPFTPEELATHDAKRNTSSDPDNIPF